MNSVATFTDVPIYEGSQIVTNEVVNANAKSQRFFINNANVDISTLQVRVYEAANSSLFKDYKQANNILDVGAEDEVYFVNEIEDEKYEVFFGDGVLGKKLENNNLVQMSYIVTNGTNTNGARSFTFNGLMEDENGTTITLPFAVSSITTTSAASGGADTVSYTHLTLPTICSV